MAPPLQLGHRRWRRRRKDKDPKEAMGLSTIHDLPDDLLRWMILLRLDSPLWLVRAACVCKRWRRAVTDGGRAFLRLARSLHPPTVVGQYHNHTDGGGGHWFLPLSSHIDGSRFFSVVDRYTSVVADCRGGLVLLRARYGPCARFVPDLVVYDPLTRRRRPISRPCPPNKHDYRYCVTDVFLLDGGDDDDGNISISNFRVLYCLDAAADTDPQACVFSTANGGEWDWLFSIDDVNMMEMVVLPEQTRNVFDYTLPWPHQFLRP